MTSGDNSDDRTRRQRVIDALVGLALESDQHPLSRVEWKAIRERAKIGNDTLASEFGDRETLDQVAVETMLDQDVTRMYANVGDQLCAEQYRVGESVPGIAGAIWRTTSRGLALSFRLAIWPYAVYGQSELASQIRSCLLRWYHDPDIHGAKVVARFLQHHKDLIEPDPDGLTADEFAMAATVVMEGFAIRAGLDPRGGISESRLPKKRAEELLAQLREEWQVEPWAVADEVPAKVMVILFASMFRLRGDDCHRSAVQLLAALDEVRGSPQPTGR